MAYHLFLRIEFFGDPYLVMSSLTSIVKMLFTPFDVSLGFILVYFSDRSSSNSILF